MSTQGTNQHFIPQFLIKKFLPKKGDKKVFFYSMQDGSYEKKKAKEIFSAISYYDRKNNEEINIDKSLLKVESNKKLYKIFDKIKQNNIDLCLEEKEILCQFYDNLAFRCPFSALQMNLSTMSQNIMLPTDVLQNSILTYNHVAEDKQYKENFSEDFSRLFGTPKYVNFVIINNDTEDEYILPDNPVVNFYSMTSKYLDIFTNSASILPVSRKQILIKSGRIKKSYHINASEINKNSIRGMENWFVTIVTCLQLANSFLNIVSSSSSKKLDKYIELYKNTLYIDSRIDEYYRKFIYKFADNHFDFLKSYTTEFELKDINMFRNSILTKNFSDSFEYFNVVSDFQSIYNFLVMRSHEFEIK